MIHELIHTSARRGLRSRGSGFTTVATTVDIPAALADRLESISALDGRALAATPGAEVVVLQHVRIRIAKTLWHVVSRIAPCGLDYSGRPNRIAHHIALPANIQPANALSAVSPIALLLDGQLFARRWDSEPRHLPARDVTRREPVAPRPCAAWATATGDAGWGAAPIRARRAGAAPLVTIVPPEVDPAALIADSLSLLSSAEAWWLTFSSAFVGVPPDVECQWRLCRSDAPVRRELVAATGATVLDLTARCEAPVDDELTRCAREGRAVAPVVRQAMVAGRDHASGTEPDAADAVAERAMASTDAADGGVALVSDGASDLNVQKRVDPRADVGMIRPAETVEGAFERRRAIATGPEPGTDDSMALERSASNDRRVAVAVWSTALGVLALVVGVVLMIVFSRNGPERVEDGSAVVAEEPDESDVRIEASDDLEPRNSETVAASGRTSEPIAPPGIPPGSTSMGDAVAPQPSPSESRTPDVTDVAEPASAPTSDGDAAGDPVDDSATDEPDAVATEPAHDGPRLLGAVAIGESIALTTELARDTDTWVLVSDAEELVEVALEMSMEGRLVWEELDAMMHHLVRIGERNEREVLLSLGHSDGRWYLERMPALDGNLLEWPPRTIGRLRDTVTGAWIALLGAEPDVRPIEISRRDGAVEIDFATGRAVVRLPLKRAVQFEAWMLRGAVRLPDGDWMWQLPERRVRMGGGPVRWSHLEIEGSFPVAPEPAARIARWRTEAEAYLDRANGGPETTEPADPTALFERALRDAITLIDDLRRAIESSGVDLPEPESVDAWHRRAMAWRDADANIRGLQQMPRPRTLLEEASEAFAAIWRELEAKTVDEAVAAIDGHTLHDPTGVPVRVLRVSAREEAPTERERRRP